MTTSPASPYQPPTADSGSAAGVSPAKRIRLFGTPMILLASFFFLPVSGFLLLALNWRRMGRPAAMCGFFLLALVAALVIWPAVPLLPNEVAAAIYAVEFLLVAVASVWSWKRVRGVLPAGSYRYASYGAAILISLLSMLAGFALLFAAVVACAMVNVLSETRVDLGGGAECLISGDATEEDARFLGKYFDEIGFLEDGKEISVALSAEDGQYTLTFYMDAAASKTEETLSWVRGVGQELADQRFGRPLVVCMVETDGTEHYRTTIE